MHWGDTLNYTSTFVYLFHCATLSTTFRFIVQLSARVELHRCLPVSLCSSQHDPACETGSSIGTCSTVLL